MTVATTVASKLQDATGILPFDPAFDPLGSVPSPDGIRLRYVLSTLDPSEYPPEYLWRFRPTFGEVMEVDGIEYSSRTMNQDSWYFFNIRPDHIRVYHDEDGEGFCNCEPYEYHPLPLRMGDICEPCWLKRGDVVGVGTYDCQHK